MIGENGPPTQSSPAFWFVLERCDKDGGRPHLDEHDLGLWGGVPVPIYDRRAFGPAYEEPTGEYPQEATVTLNFRDIATAVAAAGKTVEFSPVLATITLPQRLGCLFINLAGFPRFEDHDRYAQYLAGHETE